MKDIDAYILIGGRSSRLGQDKAVVDLGGRSLAQRAFETVSSALPENRVTFVAANEAQFAIEAIIAGGRFIFDLLPNLGPISGIHAALADTQKPWIFILACDYPFVSAELIRRLAESRSDANDAVVPEQSDGRLQPLCAFYRTEAARPVIREIIDRPRIPPPMSEIVQKLRPRVVTFSEYGHVVVSDAIFTNINTPENLKDALRAIEEDGR
jgi:molybdopterin-guanine dinucleotide biosynthesis protein A